MYLKNKDVIFVGIISISFLCISLLGWLALGQIILIISLALILAVVLTTHINTYRRVQRMYRKHAQQQYQDYRQIESLFSMFSLLNVNFPFPRMREKAISPDFANTIISIIHERKPRLILEAGCGISTLVAAYSLKEIGYGTIISLEHMEKFAEINKNTIAKHGLQDFSNVIHAPLKEVAIGDSTWLWYDTAKLEEVSSIDMLIIDGPPWHIQKNARYPALPVLFELLSDNVIILIDDAFREDEKEILDMWQRDFDCLKYEMIDSEEGTLIIQKKTNTCLVQLRG